MSVQLTVLGNINIDFVVQADRLPTVGETLRADHFQIIPGGKAANQAVAAARLGAQVTLIGRVGADAFGPGLITGFQREKITTKFIRRDEEAATGAAFITVMPDGQNAIVSVLGANLKCTEAQVEAAATAIERSDVLLLQLGVPAEVVDRALQIAVDREVLTQLNPSPLSDNLPRLWWRVDIIVANETEASSLTDVPVSDIASAAEAAHRLRRMGIKVPVITLGPQGCVLANDEGARLVQGYPVEAVDATAAGDAFAAAFALAIAEDRTLNEAAAFANATGALTTTVAGAQPSLPQRDAVQAFLAKHGGLSGALIEEL